MSQPSATTVYLIRHAHAGDRSSWRGEDRLRPLTPKGTRVAAQIAALLTDRRVDRIISSPAVRCIQTVEPLASSTGVEIDVSEVLAEGGDPLAVTELMLAHTGGDLALCSHGDVIPEVIALLSGEGMSIEGVIGNRKGSVWQIEFDGPRSWARYHDPRVNA